MAENRNRISFDDLREQAVGVGISQGIHSAIQNYLSVSKAMTQHRQEQELFKLEKKSKELQLKKLELDPMFDPTQVALAKEQNQLETSLKKIDLQKKELLLTNAKGGVSSQIQNYLSAAKAFQAQNMPVPALKSLKMGQEGDSTIEFSGNEMDTKTGTNIIEIAKALSTSPAGAVDPDKFQENLTRFGYKMPSATSQNEQFNDDQERLISANMAYYKKSRPEIISAMKRKGILK